MRLRLAAIKPCAPNEGPGKRFVIWVQGCGIRCKGCYNSEMWDKRGGESKSVRGLFKLIKLENEEKRIEGATFLGGEPFGQARALLRLARKIQNIGLSVLTFTGYLYEDLAAGKRGRHGKKLLKYTDILIDGPFIEEEKDYLRPYAGSRNQRYFFLSERYLHLKEEIFSAKNRLEITIGADGEISLTGMGDAETLLKDIASISVAKNT